MNATQGTLPINAYFQKIRNLCREIEQLDLESKIGEARMRMIICNGIRQEYKSFITAIQGWPIQPSLNELENILASQEALLKQMTQVSIKENNEEALFSNNKKGEGKFFQNKRKYDAKEKPQDQRGSYQSGGASSSRGNRRTGRSNECFICGKKGHYA